MTPDQISTFQAVSGVSPDALGYTVRMIVGGCLFLWALWMLFSLIHHLRKERASPGDIANHLLRMSIVVMLGLILIAIR